MIQALFLIITACIHHETITSSNKPVQEINPTEKTFKFLPTNLSISGIFGGLSASGQTIDTPSFANAADDSCEKPQMNPFEQPLLVPVPQNETTKKNKPLFQQSNNDPLPIPREDAIFYPSKGTLDTKILDAALKMLNEIEQNIEKHQKILTSEQRRTFTKLCTQHKRGYLINVGPEMLSLWHCTNLSPQELALFKNTITIFVQSIQNTDFQLTTLIETKQKNALTASPMYKSLTQRLEIFNRTHRKKHQ